MKILLFINEGYLIYKITQKLFYFKCLLPDPESPNGALNSVRSPEPKPDLAKGPNPESEAQFHNPNYSPRNVIPQSQQVCF